MKKFSILFAMLLASLISVQAQSQLDLKLIKETVENEKSYYNDIVNVYLSDDPLIRLDDIALVYFGHIYSPEYRGSNDANETKLKNHMAQGDNANAYKVAKEILSYNPVSLNALFYAWRSAEALERPQDEIKSYVTKYLNILNMITTYGDGKSSRTAFRVITPDDQDHILYGILDIENVKKRELDTETLCNIITVEPSKKYQSRIVYIDMSIYLANTSK